MRKVVKEYFGLSAHFRVEKNKSKPKVSLRRKRPGHQAGRWAKATREGFRRGESLHPKKKKIGLKKDNMPDAKASILTGLLPKRKKEPPDETIQKTRKEKRIRYWPGKTNVGGSERKSKQNP